MSYEIISYTQANSAERDLHDEVAKIARGIAGLKIRNQQNRHGYEAELAFAQKANLEGVRLDFVNTQMELSFLHARVDHAQSDYGRMCDEIENIIFGAILGFAEAERVEA